MKRLMMMGAVAALIVATFTGAAEAQHRGGGFHGGARVGGFHGGGIRGGFFFGGPLYDPYWYGPYWAYPYYGSAYYSPYPYYYPPYTDYGPESAGASPSQGWYYCSNPRGYYPEVPSCRTQWQYVPPRP
jgi:hypothetical protein